MQCSVVYLYPAKYVFVCLWVFIIMLCHYTYNAQRYTCDMYNIAMKSDKCMLWHALSRAYQNYAQQHPLPWWCEQNWQHTTQVAYTSGRRTPRSRHGTKPLQARYQQWGVAVVYSWTVPHENPKWTYTIFIALSIYTYFQNSFAKLHILQCMTIYYIYSEY